MDAGHENGPRSGGQRVFGKVDAQITADEFRRACAGIRYEACVDTGYAESAFILQEREFRWNKIFGRLRHNVNYLLLTTSGGSQLNR